MPPHSISMRPLPPPVAAIEHLSESPRHSQSPSRPQSKAGVAVTTHQKGSSTGIETEPPLESEEEAVRNRGPVQAPSLDIENGEIEIGQDPFLLSTKLKTPTEIDDIRQKISHKKTIGPLSASKTASRARNVQKYYENQNEVIESLLKPVSEHRRQAKSENESDALQFKIAVTGSFVANVVLAILQVYAAVSSVSLSLFTTMADALFDPLSNVMLILSSRAVKRVDGRRFPSGKARIETAGNIVFCFLMCSVSFILIVLSARDLAAGSESETNGFHLPSVIVVAIAFVTKLSLFLYCYSLKDKYSQMHILWEDHRNDLFINGFGLLTSVGGAKLKWWIDPMGAIILSVLIATLWLRTAYSEFQLLIGVTADTNTLQLLTYICKSSKLPADGTARSTLIDPQAMTHSKDILAIDTVRSWHSGPRLIVEVDIVMDAKATLRETHDVAESLQIKLESLPDVDRAYVHVDFETSHAPEHFLKKEL